jgi:hypothetical protein
MLPRTEDDELVELVEKEQDDANAAIFEHPTRDDWHEQREPEQTCEGVLHTCVTILEIRLNRASISTMQRTLGEESDIQTRHV